MIASIAVCWAASTAWAADPGPEQEYSLPADSADRSLKLFSQQSGRGLIVATEILRGVRTRAVTGRLSASEALARMLAGTGLVPVEDQSTGAFAVTREAAPLALKPAANPDNPNETVIRMSAFAVTTTSGQGYNVFGSNSALKNSGSLMDIPQDVIVMGSDLIADIGADNSSDVLQYAGVNDLFRGESVMLRGSRVGDAFIDDVAYNVAYADNVIIDSYEIIMGPAQVFYPQASLGGVVLKTSKKPLPTNRENVTFSATEFGGRRLTYDFTGPFAWLGEGKLSYRLVGAIQGGNHYFDNLVDDRFVVTPTLEWDWSNTSVYVAYDYQLLIKPVTGNGLVTPTGALYTGGNEREEDNLPPNNHLRYGIYTVRGAWTQKLSESWQLKFQVVAYNEREQGVDAYPVAVNWNTRTFNYSVNDYDYPATGTVTTQGDVLGKYMLGPTPGQSAFGYNYVDATGSSFNRAGAPIANIPIGSAAAVNSIRLPTQNEIPFSSPNPGTRSYSTDANIYYMQQFDVVPKWVTVVGGFTFSKTESVADTNAAVSNPYAATDQAGHDWLHRVGVIFHLTREIMLYGMETTTFAPSSGVTYANLPTPSVQGKDDEAGFKTSFLDGRFSSSFAAYEMSLSNQVILAPYPAVNINGFPYDLPIGSTRSRGWNGNVSFELNQRWQLFSTGYVGTVRDQNNNPLPSTYENSWSVFTRYDFNRQSALQGLAVGGGVSRIGGRWFNMGGMTLPGNAPLPVNSSGNSLFKLHEGTMTTAFVSYRCPKHWVFRMSCENLLNQAFAAGAQGVGIVDPTTPRMLTFSAGFNF